MGERVECEGTTTKRTEGCFIQLYGHHGSGRKASITGGETQHSARRVHYLFP